MERCVRLFETLRDVHVDERVCELPHALAPLYTLPLSLGINFIITDAKTQSLCNLNITTGSQIGVFIW